jgi:hypothetical protein
MPRGREMPIRRTKPETGYVVNLGPDLKLYRADSGVVFVRTVGGSDLPFASSAQMLAWLAEILAEMERRSKRQIRRMRGDV